MSFILNLVLATLVAVATGLGSAWLTVGEGWLFRTVQVGEWTAWPEGGSNRPDPYSRALLARTGQLPLGGSEGIAFFSSRDSGGNPIRGGCEYDLSGETPQARLWTLTVLDSAGNIPTNASGRAQFNSRQLLRRPDGQFNLTLSPNARPGNWLPMPAGGALTIVLRLYDTPVSNPSTAGTIVLPRIIGRGCA